MSLGRSPPGTDAQLYAHEALLWNPSASVYSILRAQRETHPEGKSETRLASL